MSEPCDLFRTEPPSCPLLVPCQPQPRELEPNVAQTLRSWVASRAAGPKHPLPLGLRSSRDPDIPMMLHTADMGPALENFSVLETGR